MKTFPIVGFEQISQHLTETGKYKSLALYPYPVLGAEFDGVNLVVVPETTCEVFNIIYTDISKYKGRTVLDANTDFNPIKTLSLTFPVAKTPDALSYLNYILQELSFIMQSDSDNNLWYFRLFKFIDSLVNYFQTNRAREADDRQPKCRKFEKQKPPVKIKPKQVDMALIDKEEVKPVEDKLRQLINAVELSELTGFTTHTFYNRSNANNRQYDSTFPERIYIDSNRIYFDRLEVYRWINRQIRINGSYGKIKNLLSTSSGTVYKEGICIVTPIDVNQFTHPFTGNDSGVRKTSSQSV